jgi:hypothetical protein
LNPMPSHPILKKKKSYKKVQPPFADPRRFICKNRKVERKLKKIKQSAKNIKTTTMLLCLLIRHKE